MEKEIKFIMADYKPTKAEITASAKAICRVSFQQATALPTETIEAYVEEYWPEHSKAAKLALIAAAEVRDGQ